MKFAGLVTLLPLAYAAPMGGNKNADHPCHNLDAANSLECLQAVFDGLNGLMAGKLPKKMKKNIMKVSSKGDDDMEWDSAPRSEAHPSFALLQSWGEAVVRRRRR